MSALAALLPDGRLHLQHGPIDLIIAASGPEGEVRLAYAQAAARFRTVLDELVGELAPLRAPLGDPLPRLGGSVARRMVAACTPHRPHFLTPMAAVAGAVADEVLAALIAGRSLSRAYVNNGGDIALHLTPGARFAVGIVERLDDCHTDGPRARAVITAQADVRGIASSGRGGRSLSLGIADAVTVLAADGAAADAAATLIANAVDLASPAVLRQPASVLQADSDLGDRPVVVAVGALSEAEVARALANGVEEAERMLSAGLIVAAFLSLGGRRRMVAAAEQRLIAA